METSAVILIFLACPGLSGEFAGAALTGIAFCECTLSLTDIRDIPIQLTSSFLSLFVSFNFIIFPVITPCLIFFLHSYYSCLSLSLPSPFFLRALVLIERRTIRHQEIDRVRDDDSFFEEEEKEEKEEKRRRKKKRKNRAGGRYDAQH